MLNDDLSKKNHHIFGESLSFWATLKGWMHDELMLRSFFFFFLALGSPIRKTSGGLSRHGLLENQGVFCDQLRGTWRDHCFPEPFSWFLQETGLENLKITSARFLFIEMSMQRFEKSERTLPVWWRPWALAYSHNRLYTFHVCQLCRKTAVFAVFSALGCHLARKSLSGPAMPVSNKKQDFEQRKRIELFDDFWVRAYRFDFGFCPEAARRRPRAWSV